MSKIDDFGGPEAYNHYAVGWAHAMNTPVSMDQAGGLAFGRHPQRHHRALAERASRRRARSALTVLPRDRYRADGAGGRGDSRADLRERHASRRPIEGVSMLYAFNDAKAAERHETQYFEMFCNRGIYHKGWTAVTRHRVPWLRVVQARLSTTMSGSSTTPTRTGPSPRTSRKEKPKKLRRAAAAVPDRGDQVQRAPARRSHVRAVQRGPGGSPAAHQGQLAGPVRRHVAADAKARWSSRTTSPIR